MSSGTSRALAGEKKQRLFSVSAIGSTWLTDKTFEFRFQKPDRFDFIPGQKIRFVHGNVYRDYSLISSIKDRHLAICVRSITNGKLSPILARAKGGDLFHITAAFGYFLFQPSQHPTVLVATGTGIAPFVAFVRAGVRPFHLLHGVHCAKELYYRDLVASCVKSYTPCVPKPNNKAESDHHIFHGRVTQFLEHRLESGVYDFYLCGRGEMIRDATRIIDLRFVGSRVFTELFF